MNTLNMINNEHEVFLNKLATDDQFRSQLVKEPRAVLKEYGISSICDRVELPTKAAISATLSVLEKAKQDYLNGNTFDEQGIFIFRDFIFRAK